MTSRLHHAFTPFSNGGSNPLMLDGEDKDIDDSKDERRQLIELFQTYADMYPNPRLVEEYRLRDTLLQAASAASVASASEKKQQAKDRGFFSRWWFGDDDVKSEEKEEESGSFEGNANVISEDPLVYLDADVETEDETLCGTMHGLDLECIPTEVYSLARFHLASTRTRHNKANVFREGVTFSSSTRSLVVVGLGQIAELSTQQEPCLSKTSDRDMLAAYADAKEQFSLSYVRATVITDNCIAVSWGFLDGIVVIYRRVQNATSSIGWETVWILGPSNGLLENIRGREFFHDDENHPSSPMLRVSDCLPLQVETGKLSEPTTIILVLARLGGYIELIPLPQGVWDGPALGEQNTKNASKVGLRNTIAHYTSGRKIESPPNALALTTSQCHIDVLSLHALRTSASFGSNWNIDAFPDSPPSEHIICASGMNEDGLEVVSFWAMSAIFSEAQDRHFGIGTQLHSSLIEAITTRTGADISFFATAGIMKRWRKPKSIVIREGRKFNRLPVADLKIQSAFQECTTTISITAPIVKLELNVRKNPDHGAWLTFMDWNGGVEILDCELIERFAAQSASSEEFNKYQNADPSVSLATTIAGRNQIANILNKISAASTKASLQQSTIEVCDIKWASPVDLQLQNVDYPFLILFVKTVGNSAVVALSAKLSLKFVALTGNGEAIKLCCTNSLTLIATKNGRKRKGMRHFALQVFQSQEKIGTKRFDNDFHSKSGRANQAINSLATNEDPSIIVSEVLSIVRDGATEGTMTVEYLRKICHHAICRGGNVREMENQVQEIMSFLVKLGTFQLVCEHLSTEPSLIQFWEKFQNVSIPVIAKRFAARADICALTIITYRHRVKLDDYIRVLDSIPLPTDPTLFAHLIPTFRQDTIGRSFLFADDADHIVTANWSNLPSFALQTYGIQLFLDHDDNDNVLKGFLDGQDVTTDDAAVFWMWLFARAAFMQSFIGNVKHTILLLKLGVQSKSHSMSHEFEETVGSIQSNLLYSSLMSFIIEVGKFMVDGKEIINRLSSDDLIAMKAQEIVEITLRGEICPAKVVDKCFRFLRPLAKSMTHGKIAVFDLDNAISSFCIGLVEKYCANPLKKPQTKQWFHGFLCSVFVSLAVAEDSRTSKPRDMRIIREKMELLRMVKSILVVSALTFCNLNVTQESCNLFLNTFWQLCETLPAPMPCRSTSEHEYDTDTLFCSNALLGFEIFLQWPGCFPFCFLSKFCQVHPNCNMEEFGIPFIIELCDSFCAQVKKRPSQEDLNMLLSDLLEDVTKLNMLCFQGSINLPFILTKYLVPLLLKLEAFEVVMRLVEHHPNFIEHSGVELEMLKLIEDENLVEEEGSARKVLWFQDHANEIKMIFPDIVLVLDPLDRCIKACNFINSFIFQGSADVEPMTPIKMKYVLPFDLVDCILEVVPESVCYGCPQWVKPIHFSGQLLQYGKHYTNGELENDPKQVGEAILYLAAILGCTDFYSTALVKCKVVEVAVKEGLQEAAVRLCQTLIREWQITSVKNYATTVGIAGAIHDSSMDKSFGNSLARWELCQTFIREMYCLTGLLCSRSVLSIVSLCASLDLECTCFASDQQHMHSSQEESLVLPSLLADGSQCPEQQSSLSMLLRDFHLYVSLGKIQDYTTTTLCMRLIDIYITTLKTKTRLLERLFSYQIIFLGCVLGLHTSGSAALVALIHGLLESVDTELHYRHEDNCDTRSTFIYSPNSEVVNNLTKQGYSKCAAARATIMSQNKGYSAAQEWAIAHSLQTKSNQPFLSIQSSTKASSADEPIQTLRKVLEKLEYFGASGKAEFLLLHNPQARPSTEIHSKPQSFVRKQAMNDESTAVDSRVRGELKAIETSKVI